MKIQIAPGDASDIEVATAHPRGSRGLVFDHGSWAATALCIAQYPYKKGAAWFPQRIFILKSHDDIRYGEVGIPNQSKIKQGTITATATSGACDAEVNILYKYIYIYINIYI